MHIIADLIVRILAGFIIIAHAIAGLVLPNLGYKPAAATAPAAGSGFPVAAATTTVPAHTAKVSAKALTPAASAKPQEAAAHVSAALSPEQVNVAARAALVNVLCTTKSGGPFAPISGSGVVIDSRGVILTNAHVGQFFLLRNFREPGFVDCVVRTGSPAAPAYRAELLYLPPAWVADNAAQLVAPQATGTGENDYAFLRVTGPINPSGSLPADGFSHLALNLRPPELGEQMLLAAYPAGFLSGELTQTSLYASSAFSYAVQLFTFSDEKTIDLFSIGGSIESQSGSSGGAVVHAKDGSLAGIIVTATAADSTAERDLRAITLGHIERSLAAAGKGGIGALLSGDLATKSADFAANVAPAETQRLKSVLSGR